MPHTVEFKDISPNAISFLGISAGQGYHEGEKFEATLKAVNASFKECIIVIGGKLQRHTIMMDGITEDEKEAEERAVQLGTEWHARVASSIKQYLTIPHTIYYWEELITSEEQKTYAADFEKHKSEVENNISTGAMHFAADRSKKAAKSKKGEAADKQLKVIDAIKAQQHSRNYITEELIEFTHLKTLPYKKDFKTKSTKEGPRPIHFCYPFKGNKVAECVIAALKILLDNDPNIIFENIQITGEPRPDKTARSKPQSSNGTNPGSNRNGIFNVLNGGGNKDITRASNDSLPTPRTENTAKTDEPDLLTKYYDVAINKIKAGEVDPKDFGNLADFAAVLLQRQKQQKQPSKQQPDIQESPTPNGNSHGHNTPSFTQQ